MHAVTSLWRAVRAEPIRTGGLRSHLWTVSLPLAVVIPLAVTVGIAVVAEQIASRPGSLQVTAATTTNSVYWIITLTVIVFVLTAAYQQSSATRGVAGMPVRFTTPRSSIGMTARWIHLGLVAALCTLAEVVAVMLVLPAAFPIVYGDVELASAPGLRFIWAVPLFAFLVVGAGIGVGALIGHPVAAVGALALWVYVVENAIALVPHGQDIIGYMPYLNGVYGTGQEIAFLPGWSPNAALLYCGAVAVGLFVAGSLRERRRLRCG